MYQDDDVIHLNLKIPETRDLKALEKLLPNLQQELAALDVKLGNVNGKRVEILFGMRKLEKINFHPSLLREDTLQVEFPSAFGSHILDFEDGASCHLLNGGTTRMGKTCFLLYIATTIFLQNKGNLDLYITSAKLKDYYPFENIPNVRLAKDMEDVEMLLDSILTQYNIRTELLYSSQFRKATDAKSIRKLYPSSYHLFKPIFLIIDEYARFAENKQIQSDITEIVETAGFVNIHVIIASQRPDASTVLKPRIRANLLTRIAFTTVDKKNSEIILDREGAEHLGKIPGRAILIDSDAHTVQVPYLDVVECDELLKPYRKGDIDEQEQKGRIDHKVTSKIQSMLQESVSIPSLQGEQQPDQCSESSSKKNVIEWSYYSDPEGEG